jgi:fructosamine-3-kinase
MDAALRADLQALLDTDVASARPVGGGCIAESWQATLEDGERLFVKDYRDGPAGMARAEAHGLAWLGDADALATARVRAASERLLVLDWIESAPRRADFAETLGRGLAVLHASGPARFGLGEDNFIGTLAQSNSQHDDWPTFYGEERLRPLLGHARDQGRLPAETAQMADRLLARLDRLCGPAEPPARLHGDLWGGNLMVDELGHPCLVDPAVYAGHREMDLAMMRLFGGFEPRVFDAYAEQSPLAAGAAERVELYQLYPLLVHVILFGGSYVGAFRDAVRRYL